MRLLSRVASRSEVLAIWQITIVLVILNLIQDLSLLLRNTSKQEQMLN